MKRVKTDIDDDAAIVELAELLANIAQPEILGALRALGFGTNTGLGVARKTGMRKVEARELLWELVCMGLVAGDKRQDLWVLTKEGRRVWQALDGLLPS